MGKLSQVSKKTYTESSASNGERLGFILPHGLEKGLDFRPGHGESIAPYERDKAVQHEYQPISFHESARRKSEYGT